MTPDPAGPELFNSPAMKHILVVDDDPVLLSLLSRVLLAMRYRVTAAPGGPAALAALGSHRIDLVVTDYRMPEMNGRQLITALRAQRPELKALVVTGCPPTDGEDRNWWCEQPHLAKPFSPRCLQKAVVDLIGPP